VKLHLKDVVSYLGVDYLVEGLVSYQVADSKLVLARLVDGDRVLWMEPIRGDLDDRVLFLQEVHDLDINTPPPRNILYKDRSYLPAFSGTAQVVASGRTPRRTSGTCELWRYRAAGDTFLQIESWPEGLVVLSGPSAHRGMLDILPAK
jgi:hypothetical protein